MAKPKTFKFSKRLLSDREDLLKEIAGVKEEYLAKVREGLSYYEHTLDKFSAADALYESAYDRLEVFRQNINEEVQHFLEENADRLSKKQYDAVEDDFSEWSHHLDFLDSNFPTEDVLEGDAEILFDTTVEEFSQLPLTPET